jgi:tetratricopeptide (TPR) repeat protein
MEPVFSEHRKVEEMENNSGGDPSARLEPDSARELRLRGYAFYTKGDFESAQKDFEEALVIAPNDVEAIYGLGLSYRIQGNLEKGANAFRKVLDLLGAGSVEDPTRTKMLERLAKGHLNMITKGEWDLEKEIWKRNV